MDFLLFLMVFVFFSVSSLLFFVFLAFLLFRSSSNFFSLSFPLSLPPLVIVRQSFFLLYDKKNYHFFPYFTFSHTFFSSFLRSKMQTFTQCPTQTKYYVNKISFCKSELVEVVTIGHFPSVTKTCIGKSRQWFWWFDLREKVNKCAKWMKCDNVIERPADGHWKGAIWSHSIVFYRWSFCAYQPLNSKLFNSFREGFWQMQYKNLCKAWREIILNRNKWRKNE